MWSKEPAERIKKIIGSLRCFFHNSLFFKFNLNVEIPSAIKIIGINNE